MVFIRLVFDPHSSRLYQTFSVRLGVATALQASSSTSSLFLEETFLRNVVPFSAVAHSTLPVVDFIRHHSPHFPLPLNMVTDVQKTPRERPGECYRPLGAGTGGRDWGYSGE